MSARTARAGKKPATSQIDERLIKALAHPLRVQALGILNQRVASPVEIARDLGEPLANVAYHVKILEDNDCIELVRTEPRRGALEHYYRARMRPWFSKRDWKQLPTSGRQTISSGVVAQITDDIAEAMRAGVFDARSDRHLSRVAAVVDEQGWKEIATLLDDVLERVVEIQAESAQRLEDADDGIHVRVALMHHEAATSNAASTPRRGARKRG